MEYIMTGLCVVIILLLVIVSWLFRERKEYRQTLNRILNHLDLAISGKEQITDYDESMDAAITEKLNQLVSISRMNYEDADKDRELVQSLISDIAHQVRTPLTNIMLYAGLLQEKALSDDNQKMAFQIYHQSEKLDFFMKELVRSSYLETEMIAVHMEKNDIEELIAQACQEVEVIAMRKQIVFQIDECEKSGKFDLKWTKEALVNVMDNAIKYSPEKSVISVGCEHYENFFCIMIADQGIGIEEKEQGAIFKRFYRSSKVEKEQGLGIGLYLVREIIEKQNGYVKVKSVLGEGSTFYIFLPNDL
ncbi:MAG: HAMP domain-containing sensor histidine kinase [Lachnospiraceae bacterium]|nr:HAMP domain-containing sensor histidine kinase [Lachnospiraceae bacterium]